MNNGHSTEHDIAITPFFHGGRFSVVTGARFEADPTGPRKSGRGRHRILHRGTFAFDQCWTATGWSQTIEAALWFDRREEAAAFLVNHFNMLTDRLRDKDPLAK